MKIMKLIRGRSFNRMGDSDLIIKKKNFVSKFLGKKHFISKFLRKKYFGLASVKKARYCSNDNGKLQ